MAHPRPVFAALAIGSVLAGCAGLGVSSRNAESSPQGSHARAAPSIQVMAKDVTIAGPKGFCVDPGATRETSSGAFVMLGSCAVISGNPDDDKPRQPALLTASVTRATAPLDAVAFDRMAAYFTSPEGQAGLSRGKGATPVTVLDLSRDDGLVLVYARDGAAEGDVAGDYWRAVFTSAGQLVTITVSGFRETPLPRDDGARLTREFAAAIRRANPGEGGTQGAPDGGGTGGGLTSFFNRLL